MDIIQWIAYFDQWFVLDIFTRTRSLCNDLGLYQLQIEFEWKWIIEAEY